MANKTADHISLLTEMLAQFLAQFYDPAGVLNGEKILIRTDSAGASREFLTHLEGLGIQFSVPYPVPPIKGTRIEDITNRRY